MNSQALSPADDDARDARAVGAACADSDDFETLCCGELLSALADGRAEVLDAACRAWKQDPQAFERWEMVQIVGEAVRIGQRERLGRGRDTASFLAAVRAGIGAPTMAEASMDEAPRLQAVQRANVSAVEVQTADLSRSASDEALPGRSAEHAVGGEPAVPRSVDAGARGEAANDRTWRWPAAAAAVVAVAASVIGVGMWRGEDGSATALALQGGSPAQQAVADAAHDPQIDQFLRAHRDPAGAMMAMGNARVQSVVLER